MPFTKPIPEWDATGTEPPASTKQNGWQAGDKPPADWFNWFFHLVYQALQELQQNGYTQAEITQAITTAVSAAATTAQNNLAAHTSRTDNPHSVTKAQVGLGNADNTADVNKPVSTAQAAADTTTYNNALNWVKSFGLGSASKDISGTDLNTLKGVTGFYKGTSLTNAPGAGYWLILCSAYDGSYTSQIAQASNSNILFVRNFTDTTWSSWRQIAETDDINAINTGANFLAKLLTVDGSGSGLDGDMVDGKHYSDITTAINNAVATLQAITQNAKITADDGSYQQIFSNDADFVTAFKTMSNGLHYVGESDIGAHILCLVNGDYGYAFTINAGGNFGNTGDLHVRTLINGTFSSWIKINDAPADIVAKLLTVDGSGSGLDADLLDGHDSGYFLSGQNVTDSGWQPLTLLQGVTGWGYVRKIIISGIVTICTIKFSLSNIANDGAVANFPSDFAPTNGFGIVTGAANAMGIINRFMNLSIGQDGYISTYGINGLGNYNPGDSYDFSTSWLK